MADDPEQYVKQEVSEIGEHGRVAKATRLITERASMRIGKMACEIALQRPRKVRELAQRSSARGARSLPSRSSILLSSSSSCSQLPFRVVLECLFDSDNEETFDDLAHISWSHAIYPARHDHTQVKRLVCD